MTRRILHKFALLALIAGFGVPVGAAEKMSCQSPAGARENIVRDATRTYANGAIRLILLDAMEPACCSTYVMILHPNAVTGQRECTVVGRSEGFGWGKIDLHSAHASYDARRGLKVTLPVEAFDGQDFRDGSFSVTINQALGTVLVE